MADINEIQVYIDEHHKRCTEALNLIVKLSDTGSDEHKTAFGGRFCSGLPAPAWRLVEMIREVAIDALKE